MKENGVAFRELGLKATSTRYEVKQKLPVILIFCSESTLSPK